MERLGLNQTAWGTLCTGHRRFACRVSSWLCAVLRREVTQIHRPPGHECPALEHCVGLETANAIGAFSSVDNLPGMTFKKFLVNGLLIESHLPAYQLHDYFLAEIAIKITENKRLEDTMVGRSMLS